MDCPILCADGENKTSCPDANCPLYNEQNETCFLHQAEACLERDDDLPAAGQAALHRLRDAAHGVRSDSSSSESNLSFLVSEVEERRKSQEQLLHALSRTEASDGALRGEVRTLVDRLATLESGLGKLEDKLGGVGRAVGTLQTDQFRVAEQLAGDLSRPMEAMASRLEEGAAATRRVLEEIYGRTDSLTAQSKEMSREIKTLAVRQDEHDHAEGGRHDVLAQKQEEILRETGTLSGQVAGLASMLEGGFNAGRQLQEELQGKVAQVFSEAHALAEGVEALAARQESAESAAERRREQSAKEHREQLQELQSALDGSLDVLMAQQESGVSEAERRQEQANLEHRRLLDELESGLADRLESLGSRMEEQAQRVESPLQGARAAMETWEGKAREVLEALRERTVEDERSRQRAREEESRELNARGVLLFHQGSVEAAERAFCRAVELRPDFAEAHNNLGLVQSRLGQEDAAVDSFQKAMSCGEELPAALNNLGFLYHAQMRDAEAVEMFQKALEADPTMAPALVNLGNAYYRQDHHTQALDAWRRALELDPVNEDAERAIRSFDMQADTARN